MREKMFFSGEITTGKNFTLPPALTAWTNSTSGSYFGKMNSTLESVVPLAMFFNWASPENVS